MSTKGIVKTFAVGAALGAIAGILFAPRTGKQSQKMLLAKMHMIKGMVAAKTAALKKITAEAYEKLVGEALELAKKQKLTSKQIMQLKKDLLMRWTDIKKQVKR